MMLPASKLSTINDVFTQDMPASIYSANGKKPSNFTILKKKLLNFLFLSLEQIIILLLIYWKWCFPQPNCQLPSMFPREILRFPSIQLTINNHPVLLHWSRGILNLLFLSAKLCDSQLMIHIQKFKHHSNKSDIYPTIQEIIKDILTWYDFYKKIIKFDIIYPTPSFVANNIITVVLILIVQMSWYMSYICRCKWL